MIYRNCTCTMYILLTSYILLFVSNVWLVWVVYCLDYLYYLCCCIKCGECVRHIIIWWTRKTPIANRPTGGGDSKHWPEVLLSADKAAKETARDCHSLASSDIVTLKPLQRLSLSSHLRDGRVREWECVYHHLFWSCRLRSPLHCKKSENLEKRGGGSLEPASRC